jgi:hypothetical protein
VEGRCDIHKNIHKTDSFLIGFAGKGIIKQDVAG